MNQLSLREDQLKFKTLGKLAIVLGRIHEIYLKSIKKNQKITTSNRLDFGTLGILTDYAQKISPDTALNPCTGII